MAEFINNLRVGKLYAVRREAIDRDYKALYRFERHNVEWLSNHFLEEREETRGGALSSLQRFQVFLRYVGDPGFQTGVGEDIGVHQSTVCKTFASVMQQIVGKAAHWIKFPNDEEALRLAKRDWQEKYSFPAAIGALDCTHVPIVKPFDHGDEYVNRKNFCSINVMATCNSKQMFTSVDASWPGSVHDARIWKNSEIYNVMKENRAHAVLLGDQGFGLAPWLMTPFRNPVTVQEQAYNTLHSSERMIIERCFGQVKQRFPILQNKIRLAKDKVPSTIVSCFVLHNAAKLLNDEDFFELEAPAQPQIINEEEQVTERGRIRRNEIANAIYNNLHRRI